MSEEVVVEGCGVIVSALRRLLAGACGRDSPIILESRRKILLGTGLELSGLGR